MSYYHSKRYCYNSSTKKKKNAFYINNVNLAMSKSRAVSIPIDQAKVGTSHNKHVQLYNDSGNFHSIGSTPTLMCKTYVLNATKTDANIQLNVDWTALSEPDDDLTNGPEAITNPAETITNQPEAIANQPEAIANQPEAIANQPEAITYQPKATFYVMYNNGDTIQELMRVEDTAPASDTPVATVYHSNISNVGNGIYMLYGLIDGYIMNSLENPGHYDIEVALY